jgi:hypothetical protein
MLQPKRLHSSIDSGVVRLLFSAKGCCYWSRVKPPRQDTAAAVAIVANRSELHNSKKEISSEAVDSTGELRHKAVTFQNSNPNCSYKEETMKSNGNPMLGLVFALAIVTGASSSSFALNVGDKAPEFELESSKGGKLKLSDLKGKNVLINFYVLDFNPT